MRKALIVVLVALFGAPATADGPVVMPPWTHVLPLSPGAITLLTDAVERSAIVTGLLEELERTDIVVYITDPMPAAVGAPASYLTFLSRDATARYVLVRIDRWRVTPYERIALLGHELQHALEVAAAPEVKDAGGLAKLYRRIGWEGRTDRFETEAAQTMGNRVRRQMVRGDGRKRTVAMATAPSS